MVGVRLPTAVIKRIDTMAAEIGASRSLIILVMIEHVLSRGPMKLRALRSLLINGLLGWKGRRGRVADQIASAGMEQIKVMAAAYLAAHRGTKRRPHRGRPTDRRPPPRLELM
jgi:hypothetical protein